MKKKVVILCFGILLFLGVAQLSHAEDSKEKKESPGETCDYTLETITVTSEKRKEDVQKVTNSVTVLSDITIEDSQIESTKDIGEYVPNLMTAHGGPRSFFSMIGIRGISNTGVGDPGVALYIDDVPYSDLFIFNTPLYDIERIEVLKGPQGTLYGKNTEGGVINIVTKEPGNNFESKIKIEAGNYDRLYFDGSVNLPVIKDKLFTRWSFLTSRRDGYIENVLDGKDIDSQKTISGRGSLIYKPTDRFDINFKFGISELDDDGGYPWVPLDKAKYSTATGLQEIDDFETAFNYFGESSSDNILSALRIKGEFAYFDIVSVTGYRNNDNEFTMDGDYTPQPLYIGFASRQTEALTQEIRFVSKASDKSFKWIAGLYYGDETVEQDTGYMLDEVYADYMGLPVYTRDNIFSAIDKKDASIFGQNTLRFFDDHLGFTTGLRYERAKRTMDRTHTFGGVETVPAMNGLEKTYSEFLPKVALDYLINEDVMVYCSFAKGYKAGGFTYAVDNPDYVEYDPEISYAYEIGVKSEFKDIGLKFNAAAFYTKVEDYQDRVQIDPMTVVQANATEVNIHGFELESTYALTKALYLNASFGYTKAEYDDYIDPMTSVNYKDNTVSLIPVYDMGLYLQYRDSRGIMARLEMQNMGKSYLDRTNKASQSSYTLYNLKVGYETENWDVYLSIKNLTDEEYFMYVLEDSTVGYMGSVGDPRTINITFNFRF